MECGNKSKVENMETESMELNNIWGMNTTDKTTDSDSERNSTVIKNVTEQENKGNSSE